MLQTGSDNRDIEICSWSKNQARVCVWCIENTSVILIQITENKMSSTFDLQKVKLILKAYYTIVLCKNEIKNHHLYPQLLH